jgi:hypothetical protein
MLVLKRYNPVLWGVPKGSYASNPNGPTRAIEFRKMVQVHQLHLQLLEFYPLVTSNEGFNSTVFTFARKPHLMSLLRAQSMRLLLVVLLCLEGLQLCLSSQGKVNYDDLFMK